MTPLLHVPLSAPLLTTLLIFGTEFYYLSLSDHLRRDENDRRTFIEF